MLASAGYPAGSHSGDVISGLDRLAEEVEVTHAGTARTDSGELVTAGGRVLGLTALGTDAAGRPGDGLCCRRHDRVPG